VSNTDRFEADLFLSAPAEKAPLVIFVHGYESSKEAHANQAMHVASWGMHSLSVQLPKRGPWDANGRALARIVRLIQRSPQVIDSRIDTGRIILVGHSFGASAVALAMAEGAPVTGAILLDPAAIGRELPAYLRKVQGPVLVLGADDDIATTRNRDYFFEYIRKSAELSIRDASHEDAQFPSETALQNVGMDPDTTEELQLTFAAAITSAALSLASTGTFEQAWQTFEPAFKSGRFFGAKKK
jgi:pimeloyl-ACP methyl ester carboxylesterase